MFSSNSTPFRFFVRLVAFILLLGCTSEVVFRTVIHASQLPLSHFDTTFKIDKYDPEWHTTGLLTYGRLGTPAGFWRINNAGWISAVDYLPPPERSLPLIAILGDSYIEGLLSDVDKHVDRYLSTALAGRYDVYSFAKSGWYLQQYVAVARYVKQCYQPSLLVIFVNRRDVSSSLRENGVQSPKWFQLGIAGTTFQEIPPTAYESRLTSLKHAVNSSATARYLLFNAGMEISGLGEAPIKDANLQDNDSPAPKTTDNQPTGESNLALLRPAKFMVDQLCAENPDTNIVFVADGPRYLSPAQLTANQMEPDAAAIQMACRANPQCYFLDLRHAFSADWQRHHRQFESVDGHHWSAYGNQVVAQALAEFLKNAGLVE
ncbi:MAG: hypothetical protein ACOX8V_06915 [Thermoleophilia bacterium]|jgi:hypothetical protein